MNSTKPKVPQVRRPAAEQARVVEKWSKSGLSGKRFAAAEGLAGSTLYGWGAELRGGKQASRDGAKVHSAFAEVRVMRKRPHERESERVRLEVVARGGRVIRVLGGVDSELLLTVLRAVERC